MIRVLSQIVVLALALSPFGALAEDIRLSGFAALEGRYFPDSPQFNDQISGLQPSLILNPEFRWKGEDRANQVSVVPFLRLDGRDAERTHFDVREAYWLHVAGDWELLVGANKVFWGVAESRHLVDIVNQTDAVEDTDNEDKLGQPMINLAVQKDWGRIEAFLMPWFRERTFPGRTGRIRTPQPINDDDPVFDSDLEQWHPDVALRYSHFIGDWDLGASLFHGTSREARLVLDSSGTQRIPHYDLISQAGLDLQYTSDAWLWKLETIGREGHGDPFWAAVGGFEYTFFQIAETDIDLGLLGEYLYDGRDAANAPSTSLDDDVFLGLRLAFNDVDDTEVLLGTVFDRDDGTKSLTLEAERRIGDHWTIEFDARLLLSVDNENALAPLEEDSFLNLRISRYF